MDNCETLPYEVSHSWAPSAAGLERMIEQGNDALPPTPKLDFPEEELRAVSEESRANDRKEGRVSRKGDPDDGALAEVSQTIRLAQQAMENLGLATSGSSHGPPAQDSDLAGNKHAMAKLLAEKELAEKKVAEMLIELQAEKEQVQKLEKALTEKNQQDELACDKQEGDMSTEKVVPETQLAKNLQKDGGNLAERIVLQKELAGEQQCHEPGERNALEKECERLAEEDKQNVDNVLSQKKTEGRQSGCGG